MQIDHTEQREESNYDKAERVVNDIDRVGREETARKMANLLYHSLDHTESGRRIDEEFRCIDDYCDGNGNILNQVAEDQWEAEQCQFHAEYLIPFRERLHQERERAVEEERQRTRERVEGMLVEHKSGECDCRYGPGEHLGRNGALSDVLALLQTSNESV